MMDAVLAARVLPCSPFGIKQQGEDCGFTLLGSHQDGSASLLVLVLAQRLGDEGVNAAASWQWFVHPLDVWHGALQTSEVTTSTRSQDIQFDRPEQVQAP